ncbi:DNA-directed RNA polymerase specialized sigma24 family protein [Streptosporangium becharense]|uniref:DNA-directed RNA polymerase specialized sigma24 family protein n=1 Tax=Streptosporangium becharense TaxID=1816182 RepID=A0A7W9IH35_9ACTN|nr:sigma-70 family RNA polymerase sigma factor [Streptosporangium becharense]MBB2912573.1 DNA-directed RNA polymerase specialized sigma24 family protein [Streptosporangium becharense]MBB5820597.1 DNA-directed RNA polymerase specialized sigma24 family protein [Streptosporangium becharense]
MNDGVLVEALRARDPRALAALYDCYAESVYRYCCAMLGAPDCAQVALRDTFIAAEAHIHALADSRRLEAWLYALARRECVRRGPAADADPRSSASEAPPVCDPWQSAPVAAPDGDADLRVVAWHAVRSMSPGDREILELSCRHGLGPADLAAVLGVGVKTAGALYESARERLRDVVTAEVLVRRGPHDCAGRARLAAGFSGEFTRETRERVVRHVGRCDICAPHRVRQISAAKVFDLLPLTDVPPTLRVRVMSCFTDPELVPYRRHVAGRVGLLDGAGFPVPGVRRSRGRSRAMAGAAVAVAASAALVLIFVQVAAEPGDRRAGAAVERLPAQVEPPGAWLPQEPEPGPADKPMTRGPIDEPPAGPVGSLGSTEQVSATEPGEPGFRIGPIPPGPADRPGGGPSRPPADDRLGGSDGGSRGGATDEPGEGPSPRPEDPAAPPARPSPADPPSRPVPPGPPRVGRPDRPHPPHHDRRWRRPSDRPCRTAPRPLLPRPPHTHSRPSEDDRGGTPWPRYTGPGPRYGYRPPSWSGQNGVRRPPYTASGPREGWRTREHYRSSRGGREGVPGGPSVSPGASSAVPRASYASPGGPSASPGASYGEPEPLQSDSGLTEGPSVP